MHRVLLWLYLHSAAEPERRGADVDLRAGEEFPAQEFQVPPQSRRPVAVPTVDMLLDPLKYNTFLRPARLTNAHLSQQTALLSGKMVYLARASDY